MRIRNIHSQNPLGFTSAHTPGHPLRLLLADDDEDDRYFFDIALKKVPVESSLQTVTDGERLMTRLTNHPQTRPDILFLDLNMPRKNGSECLREIKKHRTLKSIPVVIYSTSLNESVADILYQNGAHYYIVKTDIPDLVKMLFYLLTSLPKNKYERPERHKFVLASTMNFSRQF